MFCSSSSCVSATIAKSLAGMPFRWGLSPSRVPPWCSSQAAGRAGGEHDAAADARREILLEDAAVDDFAGEMRHAFLLGRVALNAFWLAGRTIPCPRPQGLSSANAVGVVQTDR